MKHFIKSMAMVAVIGAIGAGSAAFAQEQSSSAAPTINGTSTMTPTEYYAMRKLEAQKKSTEIRKAKVEELRAKGYDVSSITPELLDGSKTEESAFWLAMKAIMQTKEASTRTAVAEELKKNGLDTSTLTSDILNPLVTSEAVFWKTVKDIKDKREIETRTKKVDELKAKGYDTSAFTPEIIADSVKFWETAKMVMANPPKNPTPPTYPKYEQHTYPSTPNTPKYPKKEEMNTSSASPGHVSENKPETPKLKPILTEKSRALLVKKFNAVPEERKSEYYAKAKSNLNVQLDKALAAKNKRLARKISETLEILDYILGNDDAADDAIINGALPE